MNGIETALGMREGQVESPSTWTEALRLTTDFIWISDAEGRVESTNPAMRRFLTRADGDQFERTIEDCVTPQSLPAAKSLLATAALDGSAEGELMLAGADGELLLLDVKVCRRGPANHSAGFAWIGREVAPPHREEPDPHSPEALLDMLLEHIPDCIYFKDLESRFVRCSQAKYRRHCNLGDGETLVGKTDFDVFGEEHAREAFEDEQRIMQSGVPIIGKLEMETHSDGRVTWALSTKMPWRDRNGNILGTFGISKDVTALKEAEARLEDTHKSLLDASRMAGMAEVASDVLHNVGNVLNSVNVSCSVIQEHVNRSKLPNLSNLSDLLAANQPRLAEFLTADPQGRQVPAYLAGLAKYLSKERELVAREVEQLNKNINHVKEIVSMQQTYARMAGTVETVTLAQLAEDALHINAAALQRHRVEVKREFADLPPVQTIKHKVLQILVNLIRNAKYAVDGAARPGGWVRLTIAADGPDAVTVSVADNGVGIPPANLKHMFTHGFTTRKNGHGFGLHSSAISARELGGTLTVASEGTGHGATFTLRLPIAYQPPRA